jgi:phage tail protein X
MAIQGSDLITVQGAFITVDLLVWRRYRVRARGIVEITLDINPHLAALHRLSPFLPPGTQVRIPIDPDILRGAPHPTKTVQLWR